MDIGLCALVFVSLVLVIVVLAAFGEKEDFEPPNPDFDDRI